MSMTPPPPPPPPPSMPLGGFGAPLGPVSPTGQPLADGGMRVLARFLDIVILGIINATIVFTLIVGSSAGLTGSVDEDVSDASVFLAQLVGFAISFAWEPLLTKLQGGTPMKLAFGMKVVRGRSSGATQ